MMANSKFILMFTLLTIRIPDSNQELSLDNLTTDQKQAISELRELVKGLNVGLVEEYMLEDLYLLKWLTANNFEVETTMKKLEDNLVWRKENNLKTILAEDWSNMNSKFPYMIVDSDDDTNPVLYFAYGEWDISELMDLDRLQSELGRYFNKMMEEADAKVRELHRERRMVTQFTVIINQEGYSMQGHGSIQCIKFYAHLAQTLEKHYPRSADKIMFINAPKVFEIAFSVVKVVLSESCTNRIDVFGHDEETWSSSLFQVIEKNRITLKLDKK